MQLVNF